MAPPDASFPAKGEIVPLKCSVRRGERGRDRKRDREKMRERGERETEKNGEREKEKRRKRGGESAFVCVCVRECVYACVYACVCVRQREKEREESRSPLPTVFVGARISSFPGREYRCIGVPILFSARDSRRRQRGGKEEDERGSTDSFREKCPPRGTTSEQCISWRERAMVVRVAIIHNPESDREGTVDRSNARLINLGSESYLLSMDYEKRSYGPLCSFQPFHC